MADYILAIDQGTTSSRVFIYDGSFNVVGKGQKEFPQIYPQAGWVEHDLDDIWHSVEGALKSALQNVKDKNFDVKKISAIGITNQRETFGLWSRKNSKPVGNAIVWQCRRTADLCKKLRKDKSALKMARTAGLVLDPYFSGTKLKWRFDKDKSLHTRARSGELAFGTIDTFLLWKLTAGRSHATDTTNASRTLLMDLKKMQWNKDALKVLNVPEQVLPEIKASDASFGVTHGLATLPDGIPIHGILGDQHAALLGQACTRAGETKVTYGTGAFLVMNTGGELKRSRSALSTVAWTLEGKTSYALEGSVFIAGAAVQWFRDELNLVSESKEIEALAKQVKDSDGVFFIPALSGLGSPYWKPEAKGLLGGITRGTKKPHIARACLEGVAFSIAEVVEVLRKDSKLPLRKIAVDGGAAANDLLMQTQADLLRVKIQRPIDLESTVRGAGYAAAIGVGSIKLSELRKDSKIEKEFSATISKTETEKRMAAWKRRVKALIAGAY